MPTTPSGESSRLSHGGGLDGDAVEGLAPDRLIGRRRECAELGAFIREVRQGGRALVLLGEAGAGKTALLKFAAAQATACRVVRTTGCQAETELAYAALHKILVPLLEGVERLPEPQRSALETVFGLRSGAPPGALLVGLAVLTLLSNAAARTPLICLVDDEQWVDRASAQALAFAARRLEADPVGVIFAGRQRSTELVGLPELDVLGLTDDDARALLDSSLVGPIDPQVREQIVREAHGNPMALLELPRTVTAADLAVGVGLPGGLGVAGRVENSFQQRFRDLPDDARRLLHIAAASPTEDPVLLGRAARCAGIEFQAALEPATESELIEIGDSVQFRHPLVRSAVLRAATESDRRLAHSAWAAVTDPAVDPDRHAWHRAQAAKGPDEEAARELESSAGRARVRGGLAAAAAFLRLAARLTPDHAQRVGRLLAAAQVTREAGALELSETLLAEACRGPLTDRQYAESVQLTGQIAQDRFQTREAADRLSQAARLLEAIDVDRARETHLEALAAAIWSGDAGEMRRVAATALAAPFDRAQARFVDRLLEALALLLRDGYAAAAPGLAETVARVLDSDIDSEDSMWLARTRVGAIVTLELLDDRAWQEVARRMLELARRAGAVGYVRWTLDGLAWTQIHAGQLGTTALTLDASRSVARAAGEPTDATIEMLLAAWRGDASQALRLIDENSKRAGAAGVGRLVDVTIYARSVLANGAGDHRSALGPASEVFARGAPGLGPFVAAELIEAASRTASPRMLSDALTWLSRRAAVQSSPWLSGLEARAQALSVNGGAADELHRASVDHLGQSGARLELARGHLLYGEWLRRERRRIDARAQLRIAYEMLTAMGAMGFAGRAERELAAAGETPRPRVAEVREELSAREWQVARLARDGLSNPEIAARLFISPHTVQYHLRKVYAKLDVQSRSQLRLALPAD